MTLAPNASNQSHTSESHTPLRFDTLPADLATKAERLSAEVRSLGSVLVAYSGGVDSSLLLRVAVASLGDRAVAALATSPAYDEEETQAAVDLAAKMGARLERIETHEVEDPRYAANGADRCYFCKDELFGQLEPIRERLGLATIAYGMNRDDRGDWRPGQRAAREHGVRAPLDDVGMTKADVRALARHLDLPIWDKPALACYSSRIPYGTPVTPEVLMQIGRAERALRRLGFRQVRVRHHDHLARIEVAQDEMARLLDPALRDEVAEAVRAAGYLYVTVDLRGYRTGSLNEALLRRPRTTAGEAPAVPAPGADA